MKYNKKNHSQMAEAIWRQLHDKRSGDQLSGIDEQLEPVVNALRSACALLCSGCSARLPLRGTIHKPSPTQQKASYVDVRCSAVGARRVLASLSTESRDYRWLKKTGFAAVTDTIASLSLTPQEIVKFIITNPSSSTSEKEKENQTLADAVAAVERRLIRAALAKYGSIVKAAPHLGITYQGLSYILDNRYPDLRVKTKQTRPRLTEAVSSL